MLNLKKTYTTKGLDIDEVIKGTENIIYKLYLKYLSTFCKDEVMQLGRLAVAEALKCYDPSKGASVLSFIYEILRNKFVTALVYEFNKRNKFTKSFDKLDRQIHQRQGIKDVKTFLKDIIADDRAPQPYDNLYKDEMRQAIYDEIYLYINNKRYKKTKRTEDILYDYFYYNIPAHDMLIKYGKKYDLPVVNFKKWMHKKFEYRYKNLDKDKRERIKLNRWMADGGIRQKFYKTYKEIKNQPWKL